MNIFHKRPLSLILCIMLGGFVLYTNVDAKWSPYLFIIPAIILILPVFLRSKRIFCSICAILLALSMLASQLYFGIWFDAGKRYSNEVVIEATVEEISYDDPYNSLTVAADNVNGDTLSRYRFKMSTPRESSDNLATGDVIRFKATPISVYEVYSEDICHNLISRGINGFLNDAHDIEVISSGRTTFAASAAEMRESIRRHAVMLSDEDIGTLVAALLLGEREYLSPRLALDFRRIGLSHVLALSGMHLAILAFAVTRLLSAFRVGRRVSTLITMILSLAYMAFTGFPLSVVRAALMLSIASLLTLLSRTRDPLTSLFVSVFLIILVTPYACYDISLWLSALATFGLVSYTSSRERVTPQPREPYAPHNRRRIKAAVIKLLKKMATAILTSVFAVGATLLASSIFFDNVSILSPIVTFIFSPIIVLIMYLGMLLLAVGALIPINALLSPIVRLTEWMASELSSIRNIYISTDYFEAEIAIYVFTVILLLFVILKIRHKKIALTALALSLASVFAVTYAANYSDTVRDTDVVYADSTSTKLLFNDGNSTLLVSSGLHSEESAFTSVNMLSISHLSELDGYCVTHYSYALPKELDTLLSYVKIDRIYLPAPENSTERDLEKLSSDVISQFDTEIVYYNAHGTVAVGDICIDPIYRVVYGEGSVKCALALTSEGHRTVYLSSGMLDSETYSAVVDELDGADILIFGMHGRKYKETTYLGERITPPERIIILSSGLELRSYDELYYESAGSVITRRDGDVFYEVIRK